jgi:PAS domain S-box-containing protein
MALEPAVWGEQLLEAIDQAVIVTDLAGRVLYWSRYAEQLYGWTAAEMLGRTASALVPPELLEQGQEVVARLRRGERWAGEFVLRRRDGSTFPALVTNSPLLDGEGDLIGIVGVSTDLTPLRTRACLQKVSWIGDNCVDYPCAPGGGVCDVGTS